MEKERTSRIIAIVALVIAVVGVSIGFAAFNATLTISGGKVNGTQAANDFKPNLTIVGVSCNGAEGKYNAGSISSDKFQWSGASVNVSSKDEEITCTATVKNNSSYIAYLDSIELNGNITCGATSTSGQNIAAACAGVELEVHGNVNAVATATTSSHTNATNLTGDYIAAGETGEISFTVTYTSSVVLDADYTATLPTMTFNYSTVD